MTRKVKLDFVIDVKSQGVQTELAKFHKSVKQLENVKGPRDLNRALMTQATLLRDNINAYNDAGAKLVTLKSASETFAKQINKQQVTWKEARRNMQQLVTHGDQYGRTINTVAKEQARFRSAGFQGVLKDIDGQMTGVLSTTLRYNRGTDNLVRKQALAVRQTQAFGQHLTKVGKDMQWSGRQVTLGFTLPIALAVGALANFAAETDKNLTRILKVYNFFGDESEAAFNRVKESATESARTMAAEYGFAVNETLDVMAEFAQQGRTGAELLQMTEETMRVSFLGDVDTENARRLIRMLDSAADIANGINIGEPIEGLEGVVNQATRSFTDLNTVLNKFNVLENNTVITVADLAEELPDLIGTLNSLNLSVEFGAAALTGMKESGLNVNEAQTALRTGLQRLVSPTEKASRVFKEFTGRDLDELSSGAASAEEVILELANSLRELDTDETSTAFNKRADILSSIFGNRQSGRLSLIFDQIGQAGSAFSEAIGITGGFLGEEGVSRIDAYRTALEETQRVQESMAGQIERAKAAAGGFASELGQKFLPAMESALELLSNALRFIDMIPAEFLNIGLISAAIGGVVGLFTQIAGTLTNLGGQFVQVFSRMAGRSLRRAGVDLEIFSSGQEAVAHRLSETNALIDQQTQDLRELQQQMLQQQGYVSPDVLGPRPQSYSESRMAGLRAKVQTASAQELKQLLGLEQKRVQTTERHVTNQQKLADQLYRELQNKQKALALEEKAGAAAQEEIKLKRESLRLAIEEKKAQFDYNKLKLEEKELQHSITFGERSQKGAKTIQHLRGKGLDAGTPEWEAEKSRWRKERELSEKQITHEKAKQAKIDGEILRKEAQMAANDKAAAAAQAEQTKRATQELQAEIKELEIKIAQTKQDIQQATTDKDYLRSKQLLTKYENELLALDRQRALTAKQRAGAELDVFRAQVQSQQAAQQAYEAERGQTVEMRKQGRLARAYNVMMRGRNRGQELLGRAGGGGLALGASMLAQNFLGTDESNTGTSVGAAVSGIMTGTMIGGPVGALAGLATAAWQAREPLEDFGRHIGLLGEEIRNLTSETKTFADLIGVPFEIRPFEGVLGAGGGSASEARRFREQEGFEDWMEGIRQIRGEGGMAAVNEQMLGYVTQMMLSGMSPEEIERHIGPAFRVIEDELGEALDIDLEMFDMENIERVAGEIGRMFADSLYDLDVQGASNAFSVAFSAVQAEAGPMAGEMFRQIFDAGFSTDFSDDINDRINDLFEFDDTPDHLADSIDNVDELLSELANVEEFEFDPNASIEQMVVQLENLSIRAQSIPMYADDAESEALRRYGDEIERLLGLYTNNEAILSWREDQRENLEFLTGVAENIGLSLEEGPLKSYEDFLTRVARSSTLFSEEQERIFNRQVQRLNRRRLDGLLDATTESITEQAFAAAAGVSAIDDYANALGGLEEAEQDLANSIMDDAIGRFRDIFSEAIDMTFVDPVKEQAEALRDAYEARNESLRESHEVQQEALQEQHQAEQEAMDEQHEAREDALEAALDAEVEAVETAADAKVEALEAEGEAIEEQDRRREAAFEREKRRQEYFTAQRNRSVGLAMALVSGDIEKATSLRGEMEVAQTEYLNADAEQTLEERRRTEEEERQQAIEAIEERRDAELEALEEAHEARRDSFEDALDQERELLEARQDSEAEALATRQEASLEALETEREAALEAAQDRVEAAKKYAETLKNEINPDMVKNFEGSINEMIEAVIREGDYAENATTGTDNRSLAGSLRAAADGASDYVQEELPRAMQAAARSNVAEQDWKDFGGELAEWVENGAFAEFGIVNLRDLLDYSALGNPHNLTPDQAARGQRRHSGGGVHSGLPTGRGLRQDERPIVAQTGEYVLQKSAVKKLGLPFVESLNRAGTSSGVTDDVRFHAGGFAGALANSVGGAFLATIRTMGEAGGRLLNQRGMEIFAGRFGQYPGGGVGAGGEGLDAFMRVIKQQESGGRYDAINWDARNGPAWGAYQFLPATWDSAVRPALGYHVPHRQGTPEQQDAVARWLMGQYYQEMQSWEAVAASWYGGPGRGRLWLRDPSDPYFDRPQGGYPSVRQYIRSIVARMGDAAGMESSGFGPFMPGGQAMFGEDPFHRPQGYGPRPGLGATGAARNTAAAMSFIRSNWPNSSPSFGIGRVNAEGQRVVTDHNRGKAIDTMITRPGTFPTDAEEIARGWAIARWFAQNPDVFGTRYVIYRGLANYGRGGGWEPYTRYGSFEEAGPTLGHYDHPHISFMHRGGLVMPSMANGGKVQWDNTLANLHAGETVLTKPLTEKLERGINNMNNTNTIVVHASPGMSESVLADEIMRRIERKQRLQGVKPRV